MLFAYGSNLPEKAIYEILTYLWCANITIKVDKNAKCGKKKKREIGHRGDLSKKKKKQEKSVYE